MRSILQRIHGNARDIGFPVRRLLPAATVRTIGSFVFFDHMGPAHFEAGSTAGDVRAHPHIGLATVTYLYSGAFVHRDSLGSVQRIVPGDINWMASGRGIVHSERIPDDIRVSGAAVQGLQMWVALPMTGEISENSVPSFRHYPSAALPRVEIGGARAQILIGSAFGHSSPVLTPTRTLYAALELADGTPLAVDADYAQRGLYVVRGAVNIDGETISAGTLAQLRPGAGIQLTRTSAARSSVSDRSAPSRARDAHPASDAAKSPARIDLAGESAIVMLLGGDPPDAPRFVWWNFVASSTGRIDAAKLAWLERRRDIFPDVPGETEFIPLPASQ